MMSSSEYATAIVNASPLICLAKARQTGIINDLNVSILALQESGLFLSHTVVDQLKTILNP